MTARATASPSARARTMQGLQIQLIIVLIGTKTHRRPCDSLSDRLGIDVVALVRFHVRLTYCAGISRTSCLCSPVLGQENANLRRLPCQSTRRVRWQ